MAIGLAKNTKAALQMIGRWYDSNKSIVVVGMT